MTFATIGCLLLLGIPRSAQAAVQRGVAATSASGPRLVQSALVRPDGLPDITEMMGFLKSIPTMAEDMAVLKEMKQADKLRIVLEEDVSLDHVPDGPLFVYEETETGKVWMIFKRAGISELEAPGDMLYLMAHEIAHIGDRKRLAALILKHRSAFPKELLSRDPGDIASPRARELPGGWCIDENLWIYMTELRAYYKMNRLYNELVENKFASVRFEGDVHLRLSAERKSSYEGEFGYFDTTVAAFETLRQGFSWSKPGMLFQVLKDEAISREDLGRLRLPERISPIAFYVLATYLKKGAPPGAPEIDIDAPYLERYAGFSIKEILSGKLLEP